MKVLQVLDVSIRERSCKVVAKEFSKLKQKGSLSVGLKGEKIKQKEENKNKQEEEEAEVVDGRRNGS